MPKTMKTIKRSSISWFCDIQEKVSKKVQNGSQNDLKMEPRDLLGRSWGRLCRFWRGPGGDRFSMNFGIGKRRRKTGKIRNLESQRQTFPRPGGMCGGYLALEFEESGFLFGTPCTPERGRRIQLKAARGRGTAAPLFGARRSGTWLGVRGRCM